MKIKIILILFTTLSLNVIGQTTEFSFHFNTGLFSFRGSESETTTFYTASSDIGAYSTYRPFGKHSGFSYSLGFNAQRITGLQFIFGIRTSYESLSSIINIDKVLNNTSAVVETWNSYDSKTILTSQFINIFPFVGLGYISSPSSETKVGLDIEVLTKLVV